MPSNLNLDYYYGTEADQYSFYRIPKTLLTDPRYKSVSIEAKVLYGLLLDRMGLSVKNGWMDSEKRVYIYFTQEDAMNLMSCGKDKATKLFRELDKDGIGLIERKKQGQGRPTRIYVKNFILPPDLTAASGKAHSLRCSGFPHRTRFAGLRRGPRLAPAAGTGTAAPGPSDCGKSAVWTAGQSRTLDCGNSAVCTAGNTRSRRRFFRCK